MSEKSIGKVPLVEVILEQHRFAGNSLQPQIIGQVTFIYGNLNFWIEDPRARTYNASPFSRRENSLSEPEDVAIFRGFS